MRYLSLTLLVLLLAPVSVFAARDASFSAGRSLVAASSSPGNAYFAGISVVSTAPVEGDLLSLAGSIVNASETEGDAFLFAGSIDSRAAVGGDLRAAGGRITIEEDIEGDVVAFGFSFHDTAYISGDTLVGAADISLLGGAKGPVNLYGNNIQLSGTFEGDVTVVATGHLSIGPETHIHGSLVYKAPEAANIDEAAIVDGGITYTNASYLPGADTSRILALISFGFFLFARIFGALILAGLLAGLFPRLAGGLVDRVYTESPRSLLLTMLLGFAIFVATPVLIVLLTLTFVGIGLALLLGILYALLLLLALLYAGILLGGLFTRRFLKREEVLWHDGLFGMLALSILALIPVGSFAAFLLMMFSAGALLQLFFLFAFPKRGEKGHTV